MWHPSLPQGDAATPQRCPAFRFKFSTFFFFAFLLDAKATLMVFIFVVVSGCC